MVSTIAMSRRYDPVKKSPKLMRRPNDTLINVLSRLSFVSFLLLSVNFITLRITATIPMDQLPAFSMIPEMTSLPQASLHSSE
jgi:hypothetical protein